MVELDESNPNGIYYKNNQSDAMIAQRIDDTLHEKYMQEKSSKYPIMKILPYIKYTPSASGGTEYWKIDIQWKQDGSLAYLIVSSTFACGEETLKDDIKQEALDYIKSKNFNPDNYKIIYDLKCGV